MNTLTYTTLTAHVEAKNVPRSRGVATWLGLKLRLS